MSDPITDDDQPDGIDLVLQAVATLGQVTHDDLGRAVVLLVLRSRPGEYVVDEELARLSEYYTRSLLPFHMLTLAAAGQLAVTMPAGVSEPNYGITPAGIAAVEAMPDRAKADL